EPRAGAGREVLGLDRRRPDPTREPPRTPPVVARRRVRLEPVGPLPARLLPERRPELAEPRVGRREAKPSPLRALLVRVPEVVVGPVHLVRPLEGEAARGGPGRGGAG